MAFDFHFPEGGLKAAMLASLLSVWVLVGLFYYLNRYTKRRYFTIWTAGWLFYALWLTLGLSQPESEVPSWGFMLQQWSMGLTAVFLLWGSLRFLGLRTRQTSLGLFMVFLLVWSYLSAFTSLPRWQIELPVFGMIGLAGLTTAWCFHQYGRRRQRMGAGLLACGFAFWGLFFIAAPFLQFSTRHPGTGFFVTAVLQLFIAVSMIILVLEEVRLSNQFAFEKLRDQKDIQKELETRIESTEERYRSLFDQASEAIVIAAVDDLKILELNQTAERLLGVSRADASRQSLPAYCRIHSPPSATPRNSAEWIDLICRQTQLDLVGKDGGKTPAEVDGAPMDFEGRPAFQFFFRELTERARLEQQLRQAEKLSALGQMISGVAHEINNPLAVIKGYIELILARHQLSGATRADLEKVARESQRAARLVRNFLSFAREQPGDRVRLDLNQLIRRILDLRRFDFMVGGVDLQLELDASLPEILADADQVQQVIVNVVNNALQAMAEQSNPKVLRIASEREGDLNRLRIEDNGPGIPGEVEARIFEPFFTTKEVGTGTGLGLSIAHSIMSDHQGRVFHERSALGGAGFVLEFPVCGCVPAPEPVPAPVPEPARAPEPEVKPARILVLDDEQAIAELLGEMLSILGHRPTLCFAPPEALELIHTNEFDLIISDFRMPVMNGEEFHHAVSERKPDLARRMIFLTGDVVHEKTRAFLEQDGRRHLSKPFQLTRIEAVVQEALSELPAVPSAG
ncbi:MAG TPA: ATP-binding protein [Methylomirabilota bacterium]|nr:ATP-binding protein [Methylomirabilota bacterium]